MPFSNRVSFGATGLKVSKMAVASSYGLPDKEVERAFERGINFLFWGSRRRASFGEGVRRVAAKHRAEAVIAVQTYTRAASLMGCSTDRARKALGIDQVDLLCLAWWNDMPPERIIDAAYRLRAEKKVGHVMVSCHHRPSFEAMVAAERALGAKPFEAIMVRYNAAHPGAEQDVFLHLGKLGGTPRPGVLAFTATRWGTLLNPKLTPPGEKTPTASDCYRFGLSSPFVDVSLAGPKDGAELEAVFEALDKGPLSADEEAWMRRVGKVVRDGPGDKLKAIDRMASPAVPPT
jgi:aryl-alcohol dehydrogenase-like predicted oxidoreductase